MRNYYRSLAFLSAIALPLLRCGTDETGGLGGGSSGDGASGAGASGGDAGSGAAGSSGAGASGAGGVGGTGGDGGSNGGCYLGDLVQAGQAGQSGEAGQGGDGGGDGGSFGGYGLDGSGACAGRRLRGAAGIVLLPSPRWDRHGFARDIACEAPELLAREWAVQAQAELASVPAFMGLVRALVAVGAPMRLVEAALCAAAEELDHAERCAKLASRYAGATVIPALPKVPPRPLLPRSEELVRLASESWTDGCLAEGAAASLARHGARRSTDPLSADTQRRIARDETGHAELAWAVLEWAILTGGARAAEAVRALRDEEPAPPDARVQELLPSWDALGRVNAGDRAHIEARYARRSRDRLSRLLSQRRMRRASSMALLSHPNGYLTAKPMTGVRHAPDVG